MTSRRLLGGFSKVLRHRNIITSKVKSKYWRTTHNFGIRFLNTVEEELSIEKEAGSDYWDKALNKEMGKVKVESQWVYGVTPDQAGSESIKELIRH